MFEILVLHCKQPVWVLSLAVGGIREEEREREREREGERGEVRQIPISNDFDHLAVSHYPMIFKVILSISISSLFLQMRDNHLQIGCCTRRRSLNTL
jgi:hypothetical protein